MSTILWKRAHRLLVLGTLMTCCGGGCGYARQMTSPELKQLARDHRASTIPNRDEFVGLEDGNLDDDDFARAYPLLKSYGVGHLSLMGRPVSDLSVSLLVQLDRLEKLNVAGTKITLAGLRRLRLCKRLKHLHVQQGQFTPEEIGQVRASLPGVEVRETLVF